MSIAVAALAFCSSFLNGLLGAGGGLALVPAFIYVLPLVGVTSIGAHAASALTTVASVASGVAARIGHPAEYVCARTAWALGPPAAVGALVGAAGSALLPSRELLLVYACTTVAAIPVLLVRPRSVGRKRLGTPIAMLACAAVGVIGGAIGVGAGFLLIPVLTFGAGHDVRSAMANSPVLGVFLTIPAFIGKAATGQMPWPLVPLVFVGALAGATLGARVAAHVSEHRLRAGLVAVVGLAALRVWADVLGW